MNLRTLSALLLTALAAHGAGVKISDLGLSTSPSDNTYLEIADLNASGTNKSAKILYTNLATVATVNAARLWTNTASTVRLVTTNANLILRLGADDGAGSGTIEFWNAGTKTWAMTGGVLVPQSNYDVGTSLNPVQTIYLTAGTGVLLGDRKISAGAGTPEGNKIGEVGALFLRTDGGSGTTLYTKVSGSGNTGWQAMPGTSTLSSYVLKAGDSMTGPLSTTAFTNTARTASTFVVAAADKSDTSSAASSVLAATLTDETGTGAAVFGTNPTITGGISVTNTATADIGLVINGITGLTNDLIRGNVANALKFFVDKDGNVFPSGNSAAAGSLRGLSGEVSLYSGTTRRLGVSTEVRICNDSPLGFSPNNSTADVLLYRDSSATLQLGADAATATAQTLKAHDGSGTDKDGANLTIEGGQGTGTGRGGSLIARTSNTSTTGSTAQTYTERGRVIGKYVTLTESSATTILTIPVPATNYVGLAATITIYATDGTDHQSKTSRILVDAIAKTTTITPTLTQVDNTTAASAGTLSCTYTVADNGSNVLALKANAVSSLSQTVLRAHIVVTAINSNGTAAITEQ